MPNNFLTNLGQLKPNPEFWNNAPTGIGYHSAVNLKQMAETIFVHNGVKDFASFKVIGVDWDPVRRAAHVRCHAIPAAVSKSGAKGINPRIVLVALTRVVAMRSRRMVDDNLQQSVAMDVNPSASVRPYPVDWRQSLDDLFPKWFEQSELAVLNGWSDLLFAMSDQLSEVAGVDFQFDQIKEKFGTLGVYHHGGRAGVDQIIEAYGRVSAGICEVCGEPGRMRHDSGWYQVLCELHVKKDAK